MKFIPIAFVAGTLLIAATASAADRKPSNTDARDPSVREAHAARVEARRGGLTDVGDAQNELNRTSRCDAHKGADRDYCLRRMNGEGTISGSVKGGGIYRELWVTEPAN